MAINGRDIMTIILSSLSSDKKMVKCRNLDIQLESILYSKMARENHLIRNNFRKDPVFSHDKNFVDSLSDLFKKGWIDYTEEYKIEGFSHDVYIMLLPFKERSEQIKEQIEKIDYKFLRWLGEKIQIEESN